MCAQFLVLLKKSELVVDRMLLKLSRNSMFSLFVVSYRNNILYWLLVCYEPHIHVHSLTHSFTQSNSIEKISRRRFCCLVRWWSLTFANIEWNYAKFQTAHRASKRSCNAILLFVCACVYLWVYFVLLCIHSTHAHKLCVLVLCDSSFPHLWSNTHIQDMYFDCGRRFNSRSKTKLWISWAIEQFVVHVNVYVFVKLWYGVFANFAQI